MATELDQTSITFNLIEGLETVLRTNLIDNVNDKARAGLIRAGLLQADPTLKKINILIHTGGEEWPDVLNTNQDGPDLGAPTYTMGGDYGSSFWRRRFRIQLDIFFTKESARTDARKKAQLVMARAHSALVKWDIGRGVEQDSFGESAFFLQICEQWIREGGGAGNYNWRGEMKIEAITTHEAT